MNKPKKNRLPRLPDFYDCPECGAEMLKYTATKNLSAEYLCNGCSKNFKLEFGLTALGRLKLGR